MTPPKLSLVAPIALPDESNEQGLTPALPAFSPANGSSPRTWMNYERAQRIVGCSKILRRLTIGLFARLELFILQGHKDHATLRQIRRCRRDAESLLTGSEAFLLYSLARAQRGLDGAMAELGVYEGSSARIICEAKEDRPIYLFDTFAGLPEPSKSEARLLKRGQYEASLRAVQTLLGGYTNVHFRPGMFPRSVAGIEGVRFSLVHLDSDLYSSTLAGLEFFYPRMVPGGIILAHDYSTLPGVSRAFAEFLGDEQGSVIELPTTQAMIVARGCKTTLSEVALRSLKSDVLN